MLSDASKIQYAKAVLRRQYTGDSQTEGPLVTGKFYRITQFKTGDDFSNVGVPESTCLGNKGFTGAIFQATDDEPTDWEHESKLTELKVAELRAYSLEVFSAATDTLTLTSTSFEGGGASGEITFPKDALGQAIEQLLAEFDPDYVPAVAPASFPRRAGGYRILIG